MERTHSHQQTSNHSTSRPCFFRGQDFRQTPAFFSDYRSGAVQRKAESSPLPEEKEEEQTLQQKPLETTVQRMCAECEKEQQEKAPLQPKLSVGEAGDPYEQEADHVADQVINQIQTTRALSIQAKIDFTPPCITSLVMRKGEGSMPVSQRVEHGIQSSRGGGEAITPAQRRSMEDAFGMDFSSVRIHTGSEADMLNRSLSARAFTTGQDIFFKSGEYQPESSDGQRLLAHELTHVVQQGAVNLPIATTVNCFGHHSQRTLVQPQSLHGDQPFSAHFGQGQSASEATKTIQRQSRPSFDVSSGPGELEEEPVMRKMDSNAVETTYPIPEGISERNPEPLHRRNLPTHGTHVARSALPYPQKTNNDYIQRQADLTKAPPGLPCILKTGPGHSLGVDILFTRGKSSISPADKSRLAVFAMTWTANGSRDNVFVDGFASTDGDQITNWRISCQRAEAVRTELEANGVSNGKIVVIAHGESTEFSTSDEKENRRAVVSSLSTPSPPATPPAVPPQPAPLALKSIKFSSDHGVLKDNNANWANSGAVIEPEWITDPLRNKSISQTKGTRLIADITVNVGSPGTTFDLIGTSPDSNDCSFKKNGIVSTGADQVITITADGQLPNTVSQLVRYIVWKVKVGSNEQLAGFSGPHTLYVTYDTPIGEVTEKRMAWSCGKASGESTPEKISDKIQAGVSSDTTFGGGGTDGWDLLAGGSGDCDNQARLMKYVVNLLGITPATVELVRASTNAGAGNCLDLETMWWLGTRYLIMDFDIGTGTDWNAYEGTCKTAGHFYAITPRLKAADDYDMLKKLTCAQYWVASPTPPGNSGWGVTAVYSSVPKP